MTTRPIRCRISNSDGDGPARVDIYDDIGESFFFGGISAQQVAKELAGLKGDLDVHINSGGGNVFDGVAIAEALRAYKGRKTTFNDGLAASIASVIFQAGDRRVVAPGSMVMIHEASTMTDGNQEDHEKAAKVLGKVSDSIAQTYAKRAGGSAGQWRDAMREESWYTADEAVSAGLADEIAGDDALWPAGLDIAAFTRAPAAIVARVKTMPRAAAAAQPEGCTCGQGGCRDLDGDGDCDMCPACDTDHDYFAADGTQLQSVPGKPMPKGKGRRKHKAKRGKRSPKGSQSIRSEADESAWDASKAWHNGATSDDPAAFYRGICAGKRAGNPDTQDGWALPHHYHPGDAPNAAGVRAALARLSSTQGLTNEQAAQAHLEAHMKQINPDYQPGDHIDPGLLSAVLAHALEGSM